jgi:glycosyltransferase involved in cell wall biosynthesis
MSLTVAIITAERREAEKNYSSPTPAFGTAPEALLQGFAGLAGINVHVLSCTRQPVHAPPKLAENIWYHNLLVPKIGWMSTLYQGCIRAARKKLHEIQPDIVHGQGTEHDCALSAVFSGFPNVLTIHGNMGLIARVTHAKPFSFLWLAARLERLTIPRSRGVVCITHYTQAAVADLARRTWVVPNAVDAAFFEIEAKPVTERPPKILCVGAICLRKNQNAFIRALDPLAAKRRFEVLFLGQVSPGRSYDDKFLNLVEERPWCVYGGMANREKLKEHFSEATLLTLPSLEDNCPMVVLEAMAAGVPVVAANVGGVPDLIEEMRTGFLCDPLDAGSMRMAVEKALADSARLIGVAAHAKQDALRRFHPEVIAGRHLEIYREVLKSKAESRK